MPRHFSGSGGNRVGLGKEPWTPRADHPDLYDFGQPLFENWMSTVGRGVLPENMRTRERAEDQGTSPWEPRLWAPRTRREAFRAIGPNHPARTDVAGADRVTGTSDPSDTGRSTSGWRAAGTTAGGGDLPGGQQPIHPRARPGAEPGRVAAAGLVGQGPGSDHLRASWPEDNERFAPPFD